MKLVTIQQLIGILDAACRGLEASLPAPELENLAVMIHKLMTVQARYYHSLSHVYHLAAQANPVQSLAAVFHDLVYYQVDAGFAPNIRAIISPYLHEQDSKITLVEAVSQDDRLFWLTVETFGFKTGQRLLPSAGLNEFLSALVMNKRLERIVPEKGLLQATACIEATRPFRGKEAGAFPLLEERVRHCNTLYQLGMTETDIEQTMQWAVAFANKDVDSFAEQDPIAYLDGTWLLLPETNYALRAGTAYSIREYRQALQQMARFLESLDAEQIFHRYRQVPSEDELRQRVSLAHRNLLIAHEYLSAKLVASAVLEALADITGGSAPVSLFAGDITKDDEAKRVEDFLPDIQADASVDTLSAVFKLLDCGRASESSFDRKDSPTSLFLYKGLGPDRINQLLANAYEMFDGKLTAQDFLDKINDPIVAAIAQACAAMVPTRSEALRQYAQTRAAGIRRSSGV